jgi:DNA-binding LacI/PurR family transcriptional regulator
LRVPPNIPIYAFIKRELKNRIENGELEEGARVPSELELARIYNVSRNPTRQALRDLELEGYIVRTPGRGSFVAPANTRQRLFQQEWHTIALACPELEFHYTRTVVQGFIRYAAEHDFHTMVYFLRFHDDSETDFLSDLRNSGIEGVAIWPQHPSGAMADLLERFQKAHFPFVLIDRYVRGLETDFVVTDNEDLGHHLTSRLIERGHRSISFIGREVLSSAVEDRFQGYIRALQEAGIPYVEELTGSLEEDGLTRDVVNRIMAHRSRPTAFFCSNDGVAGDLLDVLGELGYFVPNEVELATVDDNEFTAALEVPVIAASQRGLEMGRMSAELLLSRIAAPARSVQQRFLKAAPMDEVTARQLAAN